MESQTLYRMINTEGVLPQTFESRDTKEEEDAALDFASRRVQRYWHNESIDERLLQIKDNAKDLTFLQILIFDEAHYSATSTTDKNKRETPYSKLLNYLNSEDYPNVIVLLVTATPWNLITVSSKIRATEIKIVENGEFQSTKGDLASKEDHRRTPLHQIRWIHGFESDYRQGKKMKLMVSLYLILDRYFHM